MCAKSAAREVLSHMFAKKALWYRLFALMWVSACTWTGYKIKINPFLIAVIIVGGKMILYGFVEYSHHRKYPEDKEWLI